MTVIKKDSHGKVLSDKTVESVVLNNKECMKILSQALSKIKNSNEE